MIKYTYSCLRTGFCSLQVSFDCRERDRQQTLVFQPLNSDKYSFQLHFIFAKLLVKFCKCV